MCNKSNVCNICNLCNVCNGCNVCHVCNVCSVCFVFNVCDVTVEYIAVKPCNMSGGAAQVVDASATKMSQVNIIFLSEKTKIPRKKLDLFDSWKHLNVYS